MSFPFLIRYGFCSILFKKRKDIIFRYAIEKRGGFQFWKICELSKRENLILCECDWDYSSLWKILELFIVLTFAWVRSVVVRRKISFFLRVSVVSESRWDKNGVVCVSIGVGHSVWVSCNWVSYVVTEFARDSEEGKMLRVVGRGFLPWLGTRFST